MKKLLIYIDPGFLNDIGHYYNFAVNLRHEWDSQNIILRHYVNKNVDKKLIKKFHLIPFFKYKAILSDKITKKRKNKILISFRKKLIKLIKSEKENILALDQTALYMYTSHPSYFIIFSEVLSLQEFKSLDISVNLVLFYLSNSFCSGLIDNSYINLLKKSSIALDNIRGSNKINLYIDSEMALSLYQPYFKQLFRLLPIPLISSHDINYKAHKKNNKLRIGFFGHATKRQGFNLIVNLYDELINRSKIENIEFLIKTNLLISSKDEKAEFKFFKKKRKNIFIIDKHLKTDQYFSLIQSCDLITIPHSKEFYPVQTSGLFIDALICNKIVIVPSDTWMSYKLQEFGSGRTFESGNHKSFTSAIVDVLNNFSSYSRLTNRGITNFKSFYSASSLIDHLFSF